MGATTPRVRRIAALGAILLVGLGSGGPTRERLRANLLEPLAGPGA
jgi:hypothetical protein